MLTQILFNKVTIIFYLIIWIFLVLSPLIINSFPKLTLRGFILFSIAFLIVPLLRILVWIVGEHEFQSWRSTESIISIMNIIDIVAVIGIGIKTVYRPNIITIAVFIISIGCFIIGNQLDAVGGICFSLFNMGLAFDQILFALLQNEEYDGNLFRSILDKYFIYKNHIL